MKLVLVCVLLVGCYLHHDVDPNAEATPSSECAAKSILPDAPRELWAYQSDATSGPENPVIDARGWIYFVIDIEGSHELIALKPNGELAWSWSGGWRLSDLQATCAGVRVISMRYPDATLYERVTLNGRGREIARAPMPYDMRPRSSWFIDDDVVVVRGSLGSDALRMTRVAPDGSERWTIERTGYAFGTPVANDALIAVSRNHGGEPRRATIETFSHEGSPLWSVELEGSLQGPIIMSDDSIYLSMAREDGSETTYAFELDGAIRWTLDFEEGGNWQAMATHGRTLIVRDLRTTRAVDAYTREELWQIRAHPNFDYAPVFDAEGGLLLSGGFTRVEPRTGEVLWEFNGARRTDTGFAFSTPARIAGERRIVFGAHNGEIVMIGE